MSTISRRRRVTTASGAYTAATSASLIAPPGAPRISIRIRAEKPRSGDDEHLVGRDLYREPGEPNALERARPPVGVGQPPIAPQPLAQVRESVVLPLDATELYDKARLVEEARKRSRREVEEMLRG